LASFITTSSVSYAEPTPPPPPPTEVDDVDEAEADLRAERRASEDRVRVMMFEALDWIR